MGPLEEQLQRLREAEAAGYPIPLGSPLHPRVKFSYKGRDYEADGVSEEEKFKREQADYHAKALARVKRDGETV